MKRLLQTVGSLRLTIVLVIAIAGYSAYGTFLRKEEAFLLVYRSGSFILLLVLFWANLLACTLLRLRLALAHAGFLMAHLGVLVILGGAVVGVAGGSKGFVRIRAGETASKCYRDVPASPLAERDRVEAALAAGAGRIVEIDRRAFSAAIPAANLQKVMERLEPLARCEAVRMEPDEVTMRFYLARRVGTPLPFSIRLERFDVEYYDYGDLVVADRAGAVAATIPVIPGKAAGVLGRQLTIHEFFPNFVFDPDSRKPATRNYMPENPAVRVGVSSDHDGPGQRFWVFDRHPGMYGHERLEGSLPFEVFFEYEERVKSYVSEVAFLDENGGVLKRGKIAVNMPVSCRGYTVYQDTYDREMLAWSGFMVVSDPGLWVVYPGFGLLFSGVAFIAYVRPWLRRQAGPNAARRQPL